MIDVHTGVVLDGVLIQVNVQHSNHMDMKLEICMCCYTVKHLLYCHVPAKDPTNMYNLNADGPDYRPNVVPFLDGCKSVWCKPVGTVH